MTLLTDLRDAFFLFDYDRDGVVTSQEVGAIVRSVGLNPTEQELREMVREVDSASGFNVMEVLFYLISIIRSYKNIYIIQINKGEGSGDINCFR